MNNTEKQLNIAEIELSYKPKVKLSQQPKIRTSEDAYMIFLDTWDMDKIEFVEHFKIMLLTRSNSVLGIVTVSTGGVTGTVVDPRVIFQPP